MRNSERQLRKIEWAVWRTALLTTKLSGVSWDVSCCATSERGVSTARSTRGGEERRKRRAHVDEAVPVMREVGSGHDGDGLAELDLEGLLAREADHDGDDALLERLGGAGRQRCRRILELRGGEG